MYERGAVLGLYAETPLHAGVGQSMGAIDLPIQRERHTGAPMIPGSSLKGVLRAAATRAWGRGDERLLALFGPETGNAADHASALGVTDARLLLFPVRSLYGVFAWLTCPLVLDRFRRDMALANPAQACPNVPIVPDDGLLVTPRSALARDGAAMLEELTYTPEERPEAAGWADYLAAEVLPAEEAYAPWRERLKRQLAIVPDDDFADFTRFATEVAARIALDDRTHTTSGEGGNLWYEEALPSDSVLYCLLLASQPRRAVPELNTATAALAALGTLPLARLQVGGDETTGRGVVATRLAGAALSGEPDQ